MKTDDTGQNQPYDPNLYAPDLDEHGQDTNRPLDEEEAAALNRLDTGQGWLEQGRHFHRLHRPRTSERKHVQTPTTPARPGPPPTHPGHAAPTDL